MSQPQTPGSTAPPTTLVDERRARFGRYTLERLISRGGMGEVYLASMAGAAGFRKQVCIKKILPHLSREKEFVDRFVDEAHIVVHLTHGNIVPVLDMGEVDGDLFIAMEYIAGRDLRDILKTTERRGRPLPLPIAAWLLEELAGALSYAHKKADAHGRPLRIIHRDVSPSNVLVSREGVVKLTDFGIAKAVGKLGKSITGRLQGKFCYMSPEQARGESVDPRSDVFSLGALAYEVFTGVRPFDADSDLATLEAVKKAEVEPPSTHRPELPRGVDEAILRALAADPADRFDDAADLGRALIQAVAPIGIASEAEMTAELKRLYPEGVESLSGARSLDALLAAEADALLQVSEGQDAGTVTASAPSSPRSSQPGVVLTPSAPGIPQTPYPLGPQITPSSPYPTVGEATGRWSLAVVPTLVLVLLAGLVGLAIWVWPGYLLDGELTVACEPSEAEVLVNNVRLGRCGLTVDLEPGRHNVRTELDGYEAQRATVVVRRGETARVELTLAPSPEFEARVFLQDPDDNPIDGLVEIDGRLIESGEPFRVTERDYTIGVRANGFVNQSDVPVSFARGGPPRVVVMHPEPEPVAPEVGGDDGGGDSVPSEVAEAEGRDERDRSERDRADRREPRTRQVRLAGLPDGASVSVDGGEARPASGGGIALAFDDDDEHTLVVTAPGFRPQTLQLEPGRHAGALEVDLEPELRWVTFFTRGMRSTIYVDGEPIGDTNERHYRLPVGTHDVRIEGDGWDCQASDRITVVPDAGLDRANAQLFAYCSL